MLNNNNNKIVTKEEFLEKKEFFLEEIKKGKIFIYPTDTIYGIGTNATIDASVNKIREIKKRDKKPFSIISPSGDWIINNCDVSEEKKQYLDKLPGPYTLIVKLKNKEPISKYVNDDLYTLGVRIPDNWFSKVVQESGIPFITTSVNFAGEKHMLSIDDLKKEIKEKVDYIVYEGEKQGNPSTIIDLTKDKVEIKKRN